MKKLLELLLLSSHQILPKKSVLKLYPKKVNQLASLAAKATGLVSLGGLGISALLYKYQRDVPLIAFPSAFGLAASCTMLYTFYKRNAPTDKPILIFDKEGFTYNKFMGLFQKRKYERYLWKDVISHWATGVVDQWGREIQKSWCYHVNGKNGIVSIDVLEIEIPEVLQAKVESLRQGKIQALTC